MVEYENRSVKATHHGRVMQEATGQVKSLYSLHWLHGNLTAYALLARDLSEPRIEIYQRSL